MARPALPVLLLAVLLRLLAPAGAAARDGDPPPRVVPYSVGTLGAVPAAEEAHFRAVVDATLADPRGWSLGGRLAFRRVDEGGRLRVVLAEAGRVAGFGGCSVAYSCASGTTALVNRDRWRGGAPSHPGAALRHPYRQHVVNHEVGHVLGLGHASCARPGARAPLMQQQSKGLLGCARNAWPLPAERDAVARAEGVTALAPPPGLRPGRGAGGIALGDRRSGVRARLGSPQPAVAAGGPVEAFPHARLTVGFSGDAVARVTTRAPADRTAGGVGVGTALARVRARLPRAACAPAGDRCTLGAPGAETVLLLAGGRVAAVRVATTGAPAPAPGARLHPLRPLRPPAAFPRPAAPAGRP